MRFALTVAFLFGAMAALTPAAAHGRGPWCVIENDGQATWMCYPTRRLCQRFGEAPGTAFYCVQNPAWSGGG
jgi:hypothetical protein